MSRLIWDSDAIDAITMELDMIDRLPFFRVPKWVFDRLTEALNKQPSAESCENPSEIARKSNASGDLINKIVGILIEEGQSDYKKFKLGETIRYTPSEISGILNRHKNELPSAERTGHWIFNPIDAIELMFAKPKCSECGFESADGGNYCSNCGARML